MKKINKKTSINKKLFGLCFDDIACYYKYLVLLELTAILIMFGIVIYYYNGLNYGQRYLFEAPDVSQFREADSVPEAVSQPTYRDDFDEKTADLELAFTYAKEMVQMYRAQNGNYPSALADLVPDYISSEKLSERYKYFVDLENDEFEMNMNLGPLAAELMANDGGNDPSLYELGDNLNLH